jgi:hypothetical protein
MAQRSTTQSCTVTANWEWKQTSPGGSTGNSKPVTKSGVSVTVYQTWGWDGSWTPVSQVWTNDTSYLYSEGGYSGSINLASLTGSTGPPNGTGKFGETKVSTGSGTASYSGTVYESTPPTYGWGLSSSLHNHDSSVYYDDGAYAGTLFYTGCSGSASAPSYSGSYVGQTAQTTGTGTASYSGDIPPKSGGGDPDPTPTLGVVAKNITDTSVRATIEGLMFEANYYHLFEMELWRGNEAEYLITQSWTDSSNQKYTSFDFSGLNAGSTYTLKGFVKSTSTGGRTHAGTKVFSTTGTATTRPTDWAWTTLNSAASSYTFGKLRANLVSAKEWNDFCSEINKFRAYKNLPAVTFTTAITNFDFTSAIYEQAKSAISNMATVNVPSGFYSKLVALKDALNSIQ